MTYKVLLAFDSYKGSMTALSACKTAETALKTFKTSKGQDLFRCTTLPLADGGEGTVDAFLAACGGHKIQLCVTGPYGQSVDAFYGVLPDKTVVIEIAAASGLALPGNLMRPLQASTLGTGELILHALENGYQKFIIGLGGSATNDGGMGMAHALGARFLDLHQQALVPIAANLSKIQTIDLTQLHVGISKARFTAACDVTNPLYGPLGASVVFGPQKGASEADILLLDTGMRHYATLLETTFHRDLTGPGTGAAGGMGAGIMGFLGATYVSGIDLILNQANADRLMAESDYLLTGEGILDHQSLMGKVLTGLMTRSKACGLPVVSFPGMSRLSDLETEQAGLEAVFPIKTESQSLSDALLKAESNLYNAVFDWASSMKEIHDLTEIQNQSEQ